MLPFCIFLTGLNGVWSSDYPSSIIGMQYAMWVKHSLSLGTSTNAIVKSVDLSVFAGNLYSSISPGLAILSFPFAAFGFILDGNTLNLWGKSLILDEAFVAVCSAVAVAATYDIARLYASERASLAAALCLAFATPLWPASTVLFIHGVSLMFSTLSIFSVLRFAKGRSGRYGLIASGVYLGLAGFVEYAALLLVVPIVLYLATRKSWSVVQAFLSGYSIGPTTQLIYNYAAFQNPFIFPEQIKAGAPGDLISRFDLSNAVVHSAYYLVSPYRGIIFFSPVAVLGVFALLRLQGTRIPRLDALLFMGIFVVPLVTYSTWSGWDGGLFYGPRFMILGFPSAMVPLALSLDEWTSRKARIAFLALFGISSFIEGVGALTTGFGVSGGPMTFELTSLNLPWLFQGKLDAWWISDFGLQSSEVVAILPWAMIAILWSTTGVILWARRLAPVSKPTNSGPRLPIRNTP